MKDLIKIRKDNLKSLIAEYGQKNLARMLDRSDALLNSYKSDSVKKNIGERFARHIEESLNLPYGWMDQDHDSSGNLKVREPRAEYNVTYGPELKNEKVPIISWVQAGHAQEAIEYPEVEDWVTPTVNATKNTFALRVKGDSMAPDFKEGMILIVEPEMDPQPGDYVIALNGDNEATFKQFVQDAGRKFLKPINPQYPIIPLDGYKIIGVVREALIKFR